jgi:AcrR family transcriptional regulator
MPSSAPPARQTAAEQRERVLAAASIVFAERGYRAATTDRIAQAAGVSQPYVVRLFGSKSDLYRQVAVQALSRLETTLEEVIHTPSPAPDTLPTRLQDAYSALLNDDAFLAALFPSLLQGHDPQIGPAAREGFLRIYRLLRTDASLSTAEVTAILGKALLMSTLTALRIDKDPSADAAELSSWCTPSNRSRPGAGGRVIRSVDTHTSRPVVPPRLPDRDR